MNERTNEPTNERSRHSTKLLQIPGADFSNSVGVWNPENPLIAGLWVGCLFDLIITQMSFIAMLFWPGFFVVAGARCCRSRADCALKCCVCSEAPLDPDAEAETVIDTAFSTASSDGSKTPAVAKLRW